MQSLLLDSQLLLLFVVGIASPTYISKHRRLQAYTEADFDLLIEMINASSAVVVTPNALTETSNLLGYIAQPIKAELYEVFREILKRTEEQYVKSELAAKRDEFVRLGLADTVFLECSSDQRVLLTSDVDLYLAAANSGLNALNFNHIREARGLI